jgi:hypothetical protein
MEGICAFCLKRRPLQRSHSIPDAFFKEISRKNNGNLISLSGGLQQIEYTQDTGSDFLLCKDCEAEFNNKYDKYIIKTLKQWNSSIIENGLHYKAKIESEKFARSLLSIMWRASISNSPMYYEFKISRNHQKILRELFVNSEHPLRRCSISVHRLYDKTPPCAGGFSQENMGDMLFNIKAYRTNLVKDNFALTTSIKGFLIHIFVPRVPLSKQKNPGFIIKNKTDILAPKLNIFDYQPLKEVILTSYEKHLTGNVSKRLKKAKGM